jgi:hypothetical protein
MSKLAAPLKVAISSPAVGLGLTRRYRVPCSARDFISPMTAGIFFAMLFALTGTPGLSSPSFPYRCLISPRKTFAIVQVCQGAAGWRPWVVSLKERSPGYRLQQYDATYAAAFHIAPDERHIFQEQQTDIGNGVAVLYTLTKEGRFQIDPAQNKDPAGEMRPVSESLSTFFGASTRLGNPFDHFWTSWRKWDRDGVSVEVAIEATHTEGDFGVSGWSAHYNMRTGLFYLTPDQLISNRRAVRFKDSLSNKDAQGRRR